MAQKQKDMSINSLKKEEYRKRLKDIGKRKDLIPGIYNYCDRWCERCHFTAKCANFSLSEGFMDENHDLKNEQFWDDLKIIFEVTLEMLSEHAQEMGIDLSEIDVSEQREELPKNEATESSREYGKNVLHWIEHNGKYFSDTAKNMLVVNETEVLKLNDAVEVIQWYSYFISAKIHRAFFDYGMERDENDEYYMYDNLGSAKIAIISIERSMAALGYILVKMPALEDDIFKFLTTLTFLKKYMLKNFPKAMEFKRPGFDD
mgnify:CR=1 FL=1